jgi:hypothetical protein
MNDAKKNYGVVHDEIALVQEAKDGTNIIQELDM